jgi:predicted dehydrogenase
MRGTWYTARKSARIQQVSQVGHKPGSQRTEAHGSIELRGKRHRDVVCVAWCTAYGDARIQQAWETKGELGSQRVEAHGFSEYRLGSQRMEAHGSSELGVVAWCTAYGGAWIQQASEIEDKLGSQRMGAHGSSELGVR